MFGFTDFEYMLNITLTEMDSRDLLELYSRICQWQGIVYHELYIRRPQVDVSVKGAK